MRWTVVAVAAGAMFIAASAHVLRASADAWSAAVAVEREAINLPHRALEARVLPARNRLDA
jgi:hypothetical protein